jgi:hypothetical protein
MLSVRSIFLAARKILQQIRQLNISEAVLCRTACGEHGHAACPALETFERRSHQREAALLDQRMQTW